MRILFAFLIISSFLYSNEVETPIQVQTTQEEIPKEEIAESSKPLEEEKDIDLEENLVQPTVVTKKKRNEALEKFMQRTDIDLDGFAKVTLKDAVLETIAYSENLKAQREKVVQSELNYSDAVAGYFPTLDAEYSLEQTRTTPSTVEDQKYSKVTDESYKFTFRQNLFNGGRTSALVQNKEYLVELEKNKYRILLNEEIAKGVKAYFDVVFNKKSVEVNERNMKLLEKILEIVTIKYENGALSLGDMTAIKAGVANAKSKLLKVKSSLAESLRYYEYIVGERFTKTLPFEKDFDIKIGDFEQMYARALETNPHLKNYHYNIQAQKYKVKEAQRKFAPKLDFEAGYEKVIDGYAEEGEIFQEVQNTSAGIKFTYNLFNGGKDKNAILRNYSSLRHLQHSLEEEKKKLKWNLSKLHTSITTVKDVLKSTFTEVQSSRTTVQSYWEGFKLGEQDLQVLLQGQRQLNTAELEYVKFQSSMVKDFFRILEYTGDLLTYFDVDPDNRKFIDFTDSSYMYENEFTTSAKVEAPLEQSIEQESKVIEQKINTLNSLLDFSKKLLSANPEDYTVVIKDFTNIYDALQFAQDKKIQEQFLVYDSLKEDAQISNIANGIFTSQEEANKHLQGLNIEEKYPSSVELIGNVQASYLQYLEGLKRDLPEPQVKIIEKVIKKTVSIVKYKKPIVYSTNEQFKQQFLEALGTKYTINLASFRNIKDAVNFTKENEMVENSFLIIYGDAKLVKVLYGIYDTYSFAYDDLNTSMKQFRSKFNPIIETVEQNQNIYNENIDLNIYEEPEYEGESLEKTQKEEIKKEEPLKEATIEEKPVEPTVSQEDTEQSIEENSALEETKELFEMIFLKAPNNYYTIGLSSLPNMNRANQFVSENNIEEKSIIVPTSSRPIVYYGVYSSSADAREAIKSLDERLIRNNPYVNKIGKPQALYKKYTQEVE